MIVYHGTTKRRASRICQEGFRPRKPSGRVWFSQGRGYALRRARTQARRTHDRPVVLTCDINLDELRRRVGRRRIFHRGGNLAVNAPVPVNVLRSHPVAIDQPSSPEELAAWVNGVLGLKRWKGVGKRHPGIDRLSRWVVNRLASQPRRRIHPRELLGKARQWLPEFFEGVLVDPEHLRTVRRVSTIAVKIDTETLRGDPREEEALVCLESERARRRLHGLKLMAEMKDPDLFEWCAMFLDDESVTVREGALQTMLECETEDIDTGLLEPLAESENKRVRAAAIAVLSRHGGEGASRWFERGLKDPSPCVRVKTAALLENLDPAEHRAIFELALYDPNLQVVRLAERLAAGKGFARLKW